MNTIISKDMPLDILQQKLGPDATAVEVEALRDTLVAFHNGKGLDQVSEDNWKIMLDYAKREARRALDFLRAVLYFEARVLEARFSFRPAPKAVQEKAPAMVEKMRKLTLDGSTSREALKATLTEAADFMDWCLTFKSFCTPGDRKYAVEQPPRIRQFLQTGRSEGYSERGYQMIRQFELAEQDQGKT